MTRLVLLATGWLAVGLGALGIVLPLLPTTPFVLLAAVCFARSSRRSHRWLLASPLLGPTLADWQAGRGITVAAKVTALALLWPGIGLSAGFAVPGAAGRWLLVAIALAVTVLLLRLPTARLRSPARRDARPAPWPDPDQGALPGACPGCRQGS